MAKNSFMATARKYRIAMSAPAKGEIAKVLSALDAIYGPVSAETNAMTDDELLAALAA